LLLESSKTGIGHQIIVLNKKKKTIQNILKSPQPDPALYTAGINTLC